MPLMKRWTTCVATLCVFSCALSANATTLFLETFDGYSTFTSENNTVNRGLPEISEGATNFWYGGRFEAFDDGSVTADVAVRKTGGNGNVVADRAR